MFTCCSLSKLCAWKDNDTVYGFGQWILPSKTTLAETNIFVVVVVFGFLGRVFTVTEIFMIYNKFITTLTL